MQGDRAQRDEPSELRLAAGGLRFLRTEIEAEYRAWHVRKSIPSIRAGMAAALVAWGATLLVGVALFPAASSRPTAAWIVGLMIPVLIVSWALTYSWATKRPRLLGWILPSMMVNISIAGMLGVAIAFRFERPEMGMVGVITIAFFACTVLRLHLLQTTASIAPFVALNQVLLLGRFQAGRIGLVTLVLYSLAVANAVVTCLFACAAFDRASRETYRRERIIEMQREAISREAARADVAERARQLSEALLRLTGTLTRPAPLAPGDVIEERYRIVRALGRGGMGEVHEVERVTDGRRLALKVMTGEIDRTALARFAREAQIAAQIDHPNVVPVHDVGVSPSGMLFLVMELVSGSTLAAEKQRYGDVAWALPILRQIAGALATMHESGIVHRDLKPANVLLEGASAKVADFGLASLRLPSTEPGGPTDPQPSPAEITRTGAIVGTPLYMAPELTYGIRGAQPSADVWSFGVMVHELLAGRLPFPEPPLAAHLAGRSVEAALLAAPSLSAPLRVLLDACLRRDPDERPTAAALRDALDAECARASLLLRVPGLGHDVRHRPAGVAPEHDGETRPPLRVGGDE